MRSGSAILQARKISRAQAKGAGAAADAERRKQSLAGRTVVAKRESPNLRKSTARRATRSPKARSNARSHPRHPRSRRSVNVLVRASSRRAINRNGPRHVRVRPTAGRTSRRRRRVALRLSNVRPPPSRLASRNRLPGRTIASDSRRISRRSCANPHAQRRCPAEAKKARPNRGTTPRSNRAHPGCARLGGAFSP